jgi:hypothetical protein
MRIAVLSLVFFAGLSRADFDPARWQFLRGLTAVKPDQVCALPLDRTIYAGAQADLADLRVVRDGREIPYVIQPLAGRMEQKELRPEILDRSVVPGSGLQLTLDLGKPAKHNRLRIATDRKNFRTKVRIETSGDGRRWALALADGYVFDFSQNGRSISVLTVEYPVSTKRYVRATFFGWMRTDAVANAWVMHRQERKTVWQTMAEVDQPARTEEGQTSVLALDLGANLPCERLRIETDAALFHRACEVETSENRKDWGSAGQGQVYRFPNEEWLAVQFPERHNRYVRLRIFNFDDRPIPVRKAILETPQRLLKIFPGAAGEYALYYGNPQAKRPAYDLGTILARRAPEPEAMLAVGVERKNPAYQPPAKPWSDRNPALLYGVLAAAILGMGYLTLRFLMSVKRAS